MVMEDHSPVTGNSVSDETASAEATAISEGVDSRIKTLNILPVMLNL